MGDDDRLLTWEKPKIWRPSCGLSGPAIRPMAEEVAGRFARGNRIAQGESKSHLLRIGNHASRITKGRKISLGDGRICEWEISILAQMRPAIR